MNTVVAAGMLVVAGLGIAGSARADQLITDSPKPYYPSEPTVHTFSLRIYAYSTRTATRAEYGSAACDVAQERASAAAQSLFRKGYQYQLDAVKALPNATSVTDKGVHMDGPPGIARSPTVEDCTVTVSLLGTHYIDAQLVPGPTV